MNLSIEGIPAADATRLRNGGVDANGQPPQVHIASGGRNPCRHCLQPIANGEEMLVLAYRPFDRLQPYAECGPIFLHRRDCERYVSDHLPGWFEHLSPAVIRGYGSDNVIRYETGDVVDGKELTGACERILSDRNVTYVHIRSKFNCFQCRVDRAGTSGFAQ